MSLQQFLDRSVMDHRAVIHFDSFSVSTAAVSILLNNKSVMYVWRDIVALSHVRPRMS